VTRILITGATGHAGSHLAERIIHSTDWEIVSLQRLPGPGPDLLAHLPTDRIQKVYHDFRAPLPDRMLTEIGPVTYIVHNGAVVPNAGTVSSKPDLLLQTNTIGTFNMLEAARELKPKVFLYASTGQVLGPGILPRKEDSALAPPHVYAAAKAAGEMLVNSYHKSFDIQTIITRVMNLFGERQQTTKFVAGTLGRLLRGEATILPVDIAGRFATVQWMHANSYADALLFLLNKGVCGETYHVAGYERTTKAVLELIADSALKPLNFSKREVPYVEKYLLDGEKLHSLGWADFVGFDKYLAETVRWYISHPEWLR
jgi:dTDP-glucose 4,6-dehydratase